LLLHDALSVDARPDEADVLAEAEALSAALRDLGHAPEIVPVTLDLGALERRIQERRPLVVVNLVESLGGRSSLIAVVPALLESLGVPFTGCPADAIHLSSNKRLAKRHLAGAGIATPPLFGERNDDANARADDGNDPPDRWIVKSIWEHASLGIDDTSIVGAAAVPRLLARRRAEHGGHWFAERFVTGREINVALIAGGGDAPVRVLPPAEIRFDAFPAGKARIVGYAAKWEAASFEYQHTPRSFDIESGLARDVAAKALACWRAFDLAGYARVDFRVDAEDRPWVLEVNTNPCLSPDAGFAAALEAAGIDYAQAVAWLLDEALTRAAS
jgi:D-alanine-D-alanine ligase